MCNSPTPRFFASLKFSLNITLTPADQDSPLTYRFGYTIGGADKSTISWPAYDNSRQMDLNLPPGVISVYAQVQVRVCWSCWLHALPSVSLFSRFLLLIFVLFHVQVLFPDTLVFL